MTWKPKSERTGFRDLSVPDREGRILEGLGHHAASEPVEIAAVGRRTGVLGILLGQLGEIARRLLHLRQDILRLGLGAPAPGPAVASLARCIRMWLARRSSARFSTTYSTRTCSGNLELLQIAFVVGLDRLGRRLDLVQILLARSTTSLISRCSRAAATQRSAAASPGMAPSPTAIMHLLDDHVLPDFCLEGGLALARVGQHLLVAFRRELAVFLQCRARRR